MDKSFADLVESLHPKFEELIGLLPVRGNLPKDVPKQGVYLFSEGDTHLYVGRSNSIRSRYDDHCGLRATDKTAAFAFKLAREAVGKIKASYKAGDDSRIGLMQNQKFREAFESAKERIRGMDFRFIEETDQNRQALLEIYCTVALKTKYNDFNTH